MAETPKAPFEGNAADDAATKVVRDARTGRLITVKGYGALKGSSFRLREGVSLLKPIAAQPSTRPSGRREDA